MARKPGAKAKAESLVPRQVIEGEATEVKDVTEEIDTQPDAATEGEQVAPAEVNAPSEEAPPVVEPDATPADFEEITLSNGSVVSAFSAVKCGRCGAQWYAKDAVDGCPATAQNGGLVERCGGAVGPIEV